MHRHRRSVPSLPTGFAALLLAAALPAQQPAPTATVATQPAAGEAHDQLYAVLWMQRSAEYRAACQQAFQAARVQFEEALRQPAWTACLEQTDPDRYAALPPAVIVDVDETMLDNSAFAARQIRAGARAFDAAAWSAWVRERQATAVPGALGFAAAANSLGVRIVYVTNRQSDGKVDGTAVTEETDTRQNLLRLGFPIVEAEGEDLVLTAGEHGDKAARRREVCKRFRVLLLVGDNLGDFAAATDPRKAPAATAGQAAEAAVAERARELLVAEFAGYFGSRWILLPNPSYGGWETVLRAQHEHLRDALRLQR